MPVEISMISRSLVCWLSLYPATVGYSNQRYIMYQSVPLRHCSARQSGDHVTVSAQWQDILQAILPDSLSLLVSDVVCPNQSLVHHNLAKWWTENDVYHVLLPHHPRWWNHNNYCINIHTNISTYNFLLSIISTAHIYMYAYACIRKQHTHRDTESIVYVILHVQITDHAIHTKCTTSIELDVLTLQHFHMNISIHSRAAVRPILGALPAI